MYLREQRIFFSVNHVFSSLTGNRNEEDFPWFAQAPAFEIRNGQMWEPANANAEKLATRLGKAGIAGSDSHTSREWAAPIPKYPVREMPWNFFADCAPGTASLAATMVATQN
jgi:hypothetical protein